MTTQAIRTAEQLGRIEGKLDAFSSRLERHEQSDLDVARAITARLDLIERRNEERGEAFTKAAEKRAEALSERVSAHLLALSDKIEKLQAKQSFSAGGWRMLSLIVGVIASLVVSIADFFRH